MAIIDFNFNQSKGERHEQNHLRYSTADYHGNH